MQYTGNYEITMLTGNAIIQIGNAILANHNVDADDVMPSWRMEESLADTAPSIFGDNNKTNTITCCVSTWEKFCQKADIHELFFTNGTSRGIVKLKQRHLEIVSNALVTSRNSGLIRSSWNDPENPNWLKYNGVTERLTWIEYWMKWAIANCETPAVSIHTISKMKNLSLADVTVKKKDIPPQIRIHIPPTWINTSLGESFLFSQIVFIDWNVGIDIHKAVQTTADTFKTTLQLSTGLKIDLYQNDRQQLLDARNIDIKLERSDGYIDPSKIKY